VKVGPPELREHRALASLEPRCHEICRRRRSAASPRPFAPGPFDLKSAGEIRSQAFGSEPWDQDPVVLGEKYWFGLRVNQSRQIWDRRSGLDPFKCGLGPSDLDPTAVRRAYRFAVGIRSGLLVFDPRAQIERYRFSPNHLLKSPCPFEKTTRSPPVVQKYLQIGPAFYLLGP
jgi:hypothetical protein